MNDNPFDCLEGISNLDEEIAEHITEAAYFEHFGMDREAEDSRRLAGYGTF